MDQIGQGHPQRGEKLSATILHNRKGDVKWKNRKPAAPPVPAAFTGGGSWVAVQI